MLPALFSASLLAVGAFASAQEQVVLEDNVKPMNIAIIGAGAAGSSAAYHLANYSSTSSVPLNITVFDRNSYVGGRSTTVYAYNYSSSDPSSPHYAVELGASIFVQANQILVQAVDDFGLNTTDFNDNPKGTPGAALGIWDGNEFVLELEGTYDWWDTAKVLWKYGLAPIKTQRLMKSVVGKFLTMYESPVFPFKDLAEAAQGVGLLAVTAANGDDFLRENGITGRFGQEVVQASTRVNYAQNLEFINALESTVCMATDGAMGVQGGNWKIFKAMIEASGAALRLETEVKGLKPEGKKWALSYGNTDADAAEDIRAETFDEVILAAPYQFSDLGIEDLRHTPDEIPYVELHVTLFASPHLLSPAFFGLAADKTAPQVILTTVPDGEPAKRGREGVGRPGFFSISLLRPITDPSTGGDEYLYKIFSAEPINSTFLGSLLNIEPQQGGKNNNLDEDTFSREDISWLYRKIWYSYPYEYPRITFEDIKLEDGLWYTSGMDSFISTMETNALMGKNVARLMIDEIDARRQGGKEDGWNSARGFQQYAVKDEV